MDGSTISFKELVARLTSAWPMADAPDAYANIDKVSSQIQHWVSSGLLEMAGVGPVETHVGRGGVRKYPTEAVFWCALFRILIKTLSIGEIGLVTGYLVEPGKELIDIAITGEGPDVYLMLKIEERGPLMISSTPLMYKGMIIINIETTLSKVHDWDAGMFFNLHKIFARVRE